MAMPMIAMAFYMVKSSLHDSLLKIIVFLLYFGHGVKEDNKLLHILHFESC